MKIPLLLLACLAVATPVNAQELDLPTVAFASAASFDWVTTHENLRQGFTEANPLIEWLDHKPKTMIGVGMAMDVAAVYGWRKVTKHHPTWRAVGLYAAAGVRTYIALRNIRVRKNRH